MKENAWRRVVFLSVTLCLGMGVICSCQQLPSRPPVLSSVAGGLKSGSLAGLSLSDSQARRGSTQSTFTNKSTILKVEAFPGLEKEPADDLIKEGIISLEALYANALSPYPGDISNKIVSNEKFRPRFLKREANGQTYQYFILYANERLGYGATAEDLLKYKSLLGWLYCQDSGSLYKVRVFMPIDTSQERLEQVFLSLTCP